MLRPLATGMPLRRRQPIQVPILVAPSCVCVESDVGPVLQPESSGVAAVPVYRHHGRLAGAGPVIQFGTQKGQRRRRRPHSVRRSCSRFCALSLVAGRSSADRRTFPNHCWWVAGQAHRSTETGPTNGCERFGRCVKLWLCPSHPSQSAGSGRIDTCLLVH